MSRFLQKKYQSIAPYTPGEQPQTRGIVKLNTNESAFPPSPRAAQALTKNAADSLRLYSDLSAAALTRAIANQYGLKQEQVTASNGSDEVLAFCVQAFGGDGARFPDITYAFYRVWCNFYGIPYAELPLRDDFTVDPDAYAGDSSMVLLANPNAPTGIFQPLPSVQRILAANPGHVVVVDEAYVDFGGESAAKLIAEYDNLIVVQTFSKSRSLAGARIGFAMAQQPLIEDLNRIRFSFHPYNVNSLSILCGEAVMLDREYFDSCRRSVMQTRDETAQALRDLGCKVLPSCANFLFTLCPGHPGAEVARQLRARNILVRRFDEPRIRDWLRISVGSSNDMALLLSALRDILKGGQSA